MKLQPDVSSVSPSSELSYRQSESVIHSDVRLTLDTSVFESFTVANLPLLALWLIIYFSVLLSHRRSTQFLSKLNPLSF